jgi:seryl-tRNA synthetase
MLSRGFMDPAVLQKLKLEMHNFDATSDAKLLQRHESSSSLKEAMRLASSYKAALDSLDEIKAHREELTTKINTFN